MTRILVATPVRAPLHPALWARMTALHAELPRANPGLRLDIAVSPNSIHPPAGSDAFTAHAQARNELLARYLRPDHAYVLWIDADVVAYPPDLPTRLLAVHPAAVVAPIVLIEGTQTFYDVYGFRALGGEPVMATWAPRSEDTTSVPLSEVGTCYLVPAEVYRCGAEYAPTPGHTEHYAVMAAARAWGWPVLCDPTMTIEHADLSQYGERWHTSLPVGVGR